MMTSSSKSMEGIKGVCLLCDKQTVVLLPHQSTNFIQKLFGLLENQINVRKYTPACCEIKACFSCLFEIITMDKFKQNLSGVCENDNVCSLCKAKDNLVSTKGLDNFHRLVETVLLKKMRPTECAVCLQCVMYFNWLNRIKDNLFKKYSFLKPSNKSHETETLDRQLRHLKPLKNLDLHVNVNKKDAKLWEKVPYVQLDICKLKKGGFKASKKPKPKLNKKPLKKPKVLKVKLWQNFKKVSSRKAKSIKKKLVVNLINTELKPQPTVTENSELEQVAESNVAPQTCASSDDEWASVGNVKHIQENNDAIFDELLNAEKNNSCVDNGEAETIVVSQKLGQEISIGELEEINRIDEVLRSTTEQPETKDTISSDEVDENNDTNQQTDGQNDSPTITGNLVCCNKKFEQFSNNIFL